jgi:hypothetical protein
MENAPSLSAGERSPEGLKISTSSCINEEGDSVTPILSHFSGCVNAASGA